MTRDDVLMAVNAAFDARCEASIGFWNVRVETTPKREIVFSADWVVLHVNDSSDQIENLVERLKNIRADQWHEDKTSGTLTYVVR